MTRSAIPSVLSYHGCLGNPPATQPILTSLFAKVKDECVRIVTVSIHFLTCCSMRSFMTAAVQHERGPRKPKHHQHHAKDLHHHHHHHHIGSSAVLGGVPVLQAPADGTSTKLLFPGAVAPQAKPPAIGTASTGGEHASVAPPASAMFLGHQPPPPGLLQLLMSAEKCQVKPPRNFFCNCFKSRLKKMKNGIIRDHVFVYLHINP